MSDPKHDKKNSPGKVIQMFTIEIEDAATAPEMYANPSNHYAQLSDEARVKDFDAIFGLLLAESYRGPTENSNKNR
ncbi:MAG: hypothetical protein HQL19_07975 [Candidatus Omnitrophica bacterium]|nr:hypothetical protein [Candidatus Omnitrophota bacterium]